MKAYRVYRGTKGGVLPQQFWQPNDMNVRGGIELGFMSTTLTRNVAMDYASVVDKPSLVFEIQMGMIDRGAPVKVSLSSFYLLMWNLNQSLFLLSVVLPIPQGGGSSLRAVDRT